ncbi:hypothetical protein Patl1_18712 [Pistacia atlantica]|uniref:Uncharacterized protein n=1 Tax=Pistacia atlantica TaxID=434234 RepID=A0ACC1C1V6_9ROSI|nr:hypothetical protein Patl1_18712 [Pistacia atlantica]
MIYGRDELSLEKVKSNLETKEKIDKNLVVNERSNKSVGLFVDRGRTKERNSNSRKSRSKSRLRNLTCNYCKKKGHIKTDCFKWKNKQKADESKSKSEKANIVDNDNGELLCVNDTKHDLRQVGSWI